MSSKGKLELWKFNMLDLAVGSSDGSSVCWTTIGWCACVNSGIRFSSSIKSSV